MLRYRKVRGDEPPRPDRAGVARLLCLFTAFSLIAFGCVCDAPRTVLSGLLTICTSRAVLITDYIALAGTGAAFVNSGLVMLMSMGLVRLWKTEYTGNTVAAVLLMAGFALFGKNPLNIFPFFIGVGWYVRCKKLAYKNHAAGALYSTTLAPVVSELYCAQSLPLLVRVILGILAGVFIGLIIVPLAERLVRGHRGYVLFNYGFTCGFLAYIITALNKAFRLEIDPIGHLWTHGRDTRILIYILALCGVYLLLGLWFSGFKPSGWIKLMRHYGYAPNDFISLDGLGPALMNMGIMGCICTGYILLIGGDLSGPVLGAILTAVGFGASGAHPRGFLPVMAGVWLLSRVSVNTVTSPGIQLAALFGAVALSPIGGEFGPLAGITAGALHNATVSVTGAATTGFNLYNNGFAAGIVAMVLVTVLHTFMRKPHEHVPEWLFYLRGIYLGRRSVRAYREQLKLESEMAAQNAS